MSRFRKTALRLQAFEDRNMPATFNYAAGTLTVTASQNDGLSIVNSTDAPVGFLKVTDGQNTFDSLTANQPVTNVIVNMSKSDAASLTVFGGTFIPGNLTVFGAKQNSSVFSFGLVGKNFSYTASAVNDLDYVEMHDSFVAGNATWKLGGGKNAAVLKSGTIGGNLQITAGAGEDSIPLTFSDEVVVKGSVSINLGGGKNTITSQGDFDFTVGKDFTYVGGAGDDTIVLEDAFETELNVGGKLKISLGGAVGPFNRLDLGNLGVGSSMTVNGGKNGDLISIDGNANIGGSVVFNFGDGQNSMGTDGLFAGGSVSILGGLDADTVFMDRTAVGKNLLIDAKGDRTDAGQTIAIGSQEGDINVVFGSAAIKTGKSEDTIIVHRTVITGGLKIASGDLHDFVGIDDVSVAGATIIDLGGGSDGLDIDNANGDGGGALDEQAEFGGAFSVKAGAGDDKVRLSSTGGNLIQFGSKVSLFGGAGTDTVENTVLNKFLTPNAFEDFESDNGVPLP